MATPSATLAIATLCIVEEKLPSLVALILLEMKYGRFKINTNFGTILKYKRSA